MDDIIVAFKEWYNNDAKGIDHKYREEQYKTKIAQVTSNETLDDEFKSFFEEFVKNGGGIQSQGWRNKPLIYYINNHNLKEFREKVLLPFNPDFNVGEWIKWSESVSGFGQGISTIYLNRVKPENYCVVNGKSIEAYKKLGYKIKGSSRTTRFEGLLAAESDLIEKYKEKGLDNFYKADSLAEFLIGTTKGRELLPESVDTNNESSDEDVNTASVNQILYGPPGAGKTFHTMSEALKILKKFDYDDPFNYLAQRIIYDEYIARGQIKFITFHQSFSYEDFIEGIRAETENGQISYSIKDGVFKKIAIEALYSKLELSGDKLVSKIKSDSSDYDSKKSTLITSKLSDFNKGKGKPYVLIIDEINRGNTSRIFGELITLIESTKRAGSDEAMYAVLPYSQEKFTVPDNLYIIGTMNTADRSLALIDTALRRRFDFIEKIPDITALDDGNGQGKPLIIDGIEIQKMLETINNRIEALYDREHTIGHAFFMKLKDDPTIEKLACIFKNNILPLLEEYFFEDWEKIIKVLGSSVIYTDKKLGIDKLGFEYTGKNYFRNDDSLNKAETYINIYTKVIDSTQKD